MGGQAEVIPVPNVPVQRGGGAADMMAARDGNMWRDRKAFDHPAVVTVMEALYSTYAAVGRYLQIEDPGGYTAIPWSEFQFVAGLRECHALLGGRPTASLLDVGCGLGQKLRIARAMGFQPEGLDHNQHYCNIATGSGCPVHCCDAYTFDRYHKFDVIYFYLPRRAHYSSEVPEDRLERHLENVIFQKALSGTVLFPANHNVSGDTVKYGLKRHNLANDLILYQKE